MSGTSGVGMKLDSQYIPAIDVHAHYGQCEGARPAQTNAFMSGGPDVIVARARAANVCLTMVSPLAAIMPTGASDPEAANLQTAVVVAENPQLLQWVVIDPTKPRTYDQADELLSTPGCVGIKLHPPAHQYHIKEHGRQVFEFAAARKAIVQMHTGSSGCLPADLVALANDFPDVKLILSHLGGSDDNNRTLQVLAIQDSRRANVYTDTSSKWSITPGLIEWAVARIGAERILFGTDAPLYFTAVQRARIDFAEISLDQKRRILHDNAAEIFSLGEGRPNRKGKK